MTKAKKHPFYCYKKKCRKTAWDTPEYLTPKDWEFLEQVVAAVSAGTEGSEGKVLRVLFGNKTDFHAESSIDRDFFNRVIGWPEGWNYCQDTPYFEATGFWVFKGILAKMKLALKSHNKR